MVMQRVGGITWYTGDDDGVIFVAYSLLPIICPKFWDVERACDHIHVASQTVQPEAMRLPRKKSQITGTGIAVVHSLLDTSMIDPKKWHGITVDL
jgi:hypothetical protein